jgi:predicted transcriptional regulator
MDIPTGTPKKSVRQALEEWAAKPKTYLTPEQLAVCRANPAEALTILGPDAIPCLSCGYYEKKLDRHLRGTHRLTSAAYRQECKKNWGATWPDDVEAEVLCPSLREKYTSQVATHWGTPRELRRKPAHRLRGKARPRQQTVPETRLAELAAEGKTFAEMGLLLGITPPAARAKAGLLERLGFPPRGGALGGYHFEHGEPVTGKYIRNILDDFGITQRDLARELNIHHVWLGRLLRRRSELPLRAATAKLFIEYRRRGHSALTVATQGRASGLEQSGSIKGRIRQRYLLASEVRAIPEQYDVLHELFSELHHELQKGLKPDGIHQWICSSNRGLRLRNNRTDHAGFDGSSTGGRSCGTGSRRAWTYCLARSRGWRLRISSPSTMKRRV